MNTATARLINQLRAVERAPEFDEALRTEHAMRAARAAEHAARPGQPNRPDSTLQPGYAKYPFAAGLDKLCQVESQKGVHPTVVTSFMEGMMVGFGGLIRVGERLTAKGEPELETFLRSLRVPEFQRDLPDLALVTLDHLLPWKRSYPTFLMGLRLSLFSRRNAAGDRSPEWVAWYDGIFALVAWVVMRATGQKLPKFQKK